MKVVCVVIPAHSKNPSEDELHALKQCFKILGNHPIYLLVPEGLDISAYTQAVGKQLNVKYISSHWQSSLQGYNKLKTSPFFYQLFADYKYLLTYELDAFVFKDQLLEWCEKSYDYIGAPWFEKYEKADSSAKIIGVGNSGFSLRNVQKCIKILGKVARLRKLRKIVHSFKGYKIKGFSSFVHTLARVGRFAALEKITSDQYINEDIFWCCYIPIFFRYNIAPSSDAIKFSFEVNAEILFDVNKGQLPFGCHAWKKYAPAFWKPFIRFSQEAIAENN